MGNLLARLFCDLGLKCMNYPRMRKELNFPKWCPSLSVMPVGLFIVLVAFFIRRVGDFSVSRCFWCFSVLICACEFMLRERKLNSEFEPSVKVLDIPGYKSCPDPALSFEEQWINVVLTGACWGLLFLSRTAMLICSRCSISKRDREGMGCMLVLHRYGLPTIQETLPCFMISMRCCSISSDSVDDEQTGFGLQLLCCRSPTWYVNLVEHRWRSMWWEGEQYSCAGAYQRFKLPSYHLFPSCH